MREIVAAIFVIRILYWLVTTILKCFGIMEESVPSDDENSVTDGDLRNEQKSSIHQDSVPSLQAQNIQQKAAKKQKRKPQKFEESVVQEQVKQQSKQEQPVEKKKKMKQTQEEPAPVLVKQQPQPVKPIVEEKTKKKKKKKEPKEEPKLPSYIQPVRYHFDDSASEEEKQKEPELPKADLKVEPEPVIVEEKDFDQEQASSKKEQEKIQQRPQEQVKTSEKEIELSSFDKILDSDPEDVSEQRQVQEKIFYPKTNKLQNIGDRLKKFLKPQPKQPEPLSDDDKMYICIETQTDPDLTDIQQQIQQLEELTRKTMLQELEYKKQIIHKMSDDLFSNPLLQALRQNFGEETLSTKEPEEEIIKRLLAGEKITGQQPQLSPELQQQLQQQVQQQMQQNNFSGVQAIPQQEIVTPSAPKVNILQARANLPKTNKRKRK